MIGNILCSLKIEWLGRYLSVSALYSLHMYVIRLLFSVESTYDM